MGGVVGYAGALLAFMLRGAYADNLSWQHAGDALLMTVLGGVHQFLGPLWGAIAFTLLQDRSVDDHRKLVAAVRADRHGVRAAVARGHRSAWCSVCSGASELDADAARHPAAPGRDPAVGVADTRAA